ncbi:MAG: helix-turn-helix domain-containing protein [Methylococcaceae bacterium]|nr:helix-turn-helix domain-containing protein [Methylococcaceae bacterium]
MITNTDKKEFEVFSRETKSTTKPKQRDLLLQDVSEQWAVQNWLPMEFNQLTPGNYQGRIRELDLGSLIIVEENQNQTVHKRGVMKKELCTVSYIRNREEKNRFSEYQLGKNELYFLPSNTEFDIQIERDVETVYFRFEQTYLQERASILTPHYWEKQLNDLRIFDAPEKKQLDLFVQHLFSEPSTRLDNYLLSNDKSLEQLILDKILLAMNSASTLPANNTTSLAARRRAILVFNQAHDYITAAHDNQHCPNIVDICHEINVSQRTLQYSFKALLGLTPINYLRILRLNWARKHLRNPVNNEITVTDIAMQWGFWHLGRFSGDYVMMFGELPSKTLKQAIKL